MSDVVISPEKMYEMLVRIDTKLTAMSTTMDNLDERVADHEARLRQIEQRENLERRVTDMEDAIIELQRKVWALPGAATAIAAAALIFTLIRTY